MNSGQINLGSISYFFYFSIVDGVVFSNCSRGFVISVDSFIRDKFLFDLSQFGYQFFLNLVCRERNKFFFSSSSGVFVFSNEIVLRERIMLIFSVNNNRIEFSRLLKQKFVNRLFIVRLFSILNFQKIVQLVKRKRGRFRKIEVIFVAV